MPEIDWDNLPDGPWKKDLIGWSEADKQLANMAVGIRRNLMARIQDPSFIKHPEIAHGITNSLWLTDEATMAHVQHVLITALILESLDKLPK